MRFVMFDIDCLRPDHLGCYGYSRPTSPTIDAIANDAVIFENYFCADSPCLPSRMGFASGRFGINNGVVSNVQSGARFRIETNDYVGPRAENEMLMRRLRSVGYDTISFTNFADRHNEPWFTAGWSEFHTVNLKGGAETAEEINERVLPWIKSYGKRDNYFLHINYWDTHRCYKMDASWADRFKDHPVATPFPDEQQIANHQSLTGPFTSHGQFKDDKSPFSLMPGSISNRNDFNTMVTAYDASIAYVDWHVEQVLNALDQQGVLDDTVIIFTSDHGDAFGEHGIYTDHVCADECIHHIPLIMRVPSISSTQRHVDSLVYNVDLSATLCDLVGASIPEYWDGYSFVPALSGKPFSKRDYLVWGHALYTVQRAVRTQTHLMIRTYDTYQYQTFAPVELYQIKEDPYQQHDLASSNVEQLYQLDHFMNQWVHEQRTKPHFRGDPMDLVLAERKTKISKRS
jgi:choline-sulfatase